ncbi:hypothetical protein LPJ58_006505 [Coemansia sp. RSA 1591]|nr:hypothetical protein LPJ58_006505 [Coemansia sp. RSA 1591]KAJ1751152.1 hypothetical protein LPJ69_005857 [Coemansia sp. RSA 1752]KAJ1776680.1 hypothetical protein LPJ67_006370 [Coemansia sp. RSA 1938]KAJ2140889.1 hypothetical protein IW142_005153 [Coemansia sp. RSA 564]KAJ2189242.1 hypothetical protein EV181_001736 [Coemansia sp. RSA 532]KAJ2196304.1 hypothetical protein IW144_003007 [Coemansia sp. RSA 522]KAJ2257279.1 hypothetical protein GGH98_000937 [Coemansia sp. RSA 454]KAJ2279392.1 
MDDFEQSQAEKRTLRHGYRSLLADATVRKKEYLADSELLLSDLERANGLFGDVCSTAEGVLDSRFLLLSADVGAQRAHMLRIDSAAFDSLAFIENARAILYGSDADAMQMSGTLPAWATIGTVALSMSRVAPRLAHAYGPLSVEPRERRRTEGVRRQTANGPTASAHIETMGTEDVRRQENQTTRLVQKVHRILAERGPINLFRLVINPQSFAQSIENIFYVSFLIRDGRAYIDDDSGQPMIEACEPPQQQDYQSGLAKKQLIFTLDQPTWQEIIDVYGIRESVIPQRRSVRDEQGMSQISSQVPV